MADSWLLEFAQPHELERAIGVVRARGWHVRDAFSPFPLPQVAAALNMRRSRLPFWVLGGGVVGGVGGYAIQWWTQVVDYPLRIGGFAAHSPLAFAPITFESTILGAVLTGLVALFWILRLPSWWHPLFECEAFRRVSVGGFFLWIDAAEDNVAAIARTDIGARHVERVTAS